LLAKIRKRVENLADLGRFFAHNGNWISEFLKSLCSKQGGPQCHRFLSVIRAPIANLPKGS
jgi:hypothetical protein